MLIVRYSALFEPHRNSLSFTELALSLGTLEANVARFLDLEVTIYIHRCHEDAFSCLLAHFDLRFSFLFPAESDQFDEDASFCRSLTNCQNVDRICALRMINDFRFLPEDRFRLLIGCDVFFLKAPDEILSFCWSSSREKPRVLYMQDTTTFRAVPYRLAHFHADILEGLVGDFYCLAPDVDLAVSTIKSCLRLIDSWPTEGSRYVPNSGDRGTQSEQQATAILLHQFGGKPLSTVRYSHAAMGPDTAVTHSHYLEEVIKYIPTEIRKKCQRALNEAYRVCENEGQSSRSAISAQMLKRVTGS